MKINNLNWKVEFSYLDDNTYGQTIMSNQRIEIHTSMGEECIKLTLMHEIVHAYLYSYGFNQNDINFKKEDICEFIAQNIDNLLKLRNEAMKELEKSKKYVHI